ncbi:MAG TPA: amino acid ABC transporter ATP-binding protein [Candidatus Limnocylindrales bacterium]|nr:amino acid ABC transporter ATP-binding protein [Candidatus Limnocylindrales bacterium]
MSAAPAVADSDEIDPREVPGSLVPTGAPPVVRAVGIHKFFGASHVLRGCSMTVYPRETITILGRSGSGKSTFLRCLNFLEEPSAGTVMIDDVQVAASPIRRHSRADLERVRQLRLRASMVFQEFNLFPHLSVLGNVTEAPVHVKGLARAQAVEIGERYLEKVGLIDKRDEYPARLSGGQRQRVAIARALAMEPRVLLFDEPTSALDPSLVGEVLKVMEELAHEGRTMIVVTHEMQFAREAADRVYHLEQGEFLEIGPPEQVIEHPRDERTRVFLARFLGSAHLHAGAGAVHVPDPMITPHAHELDVPHPHG